MTKNGVDDRVKQVLLNLTNLFGEPREVFNRAKELSFNHGMLDSIKDLEWVVDQLDKLGLSNFISVDLGLVNQLNYYTGIMFQGFVENFGRSVIQGGRYDHLTEEFGLKVDAIGFGVYIDQLIDVLTQQGVQLENENLKLSINSEDKTKSFNLARILREQGWIVDLFSNQDSSVMVDLDQKVIKYGTEEQTFHTQEDLISKVGERRYGEG
nr:ATP phosphoribosyltransferase regulatory subunit [Piscibacillus salipiscarius]